MSFVRSALFASLLAAATALAPAARADTLLDLVSPDRYIDAEGWGLVDHCDTGWVLNALKQKYDGKVRHYLGNDLFILDVFNPRLRYAKTRDEEHLVGRQFCQAKVRMTDRKVRDVYYLLEYPWGFAGNLTHIEFCIPGMDPEHVYGRLCSTVR